MICNNCKSEIGNRIECNICGYDPTKDNIDNLSSTISAPKVPPVEIVLKKSSNKMATVALVFSLLSWYPIFGILSFIFGLISFKRSKQLRCGRVRAILALLFTFLFVGLIVGIIVMEITNPGFIASLSGGGTI